MRANGSIAIELAVICLKAGSSTSELGSRLSKSLYQHSVMRW
jgi:hypothetical protein